MQKTQETGVQSLVWEDPQEEGIAAYYSNFAVENLMDRGVWWATVHMVSKNRTQLKHAQSNKENHILCLFEVMRVFVPLHILVKHTLALSRTYGRLLLYSSSLGEAPQEKILGSQYWEYFLPLGNWLIFSLGNCD